MPLPAVNRRLAQAIVKTVPAPDLSLRGGRRPTWRPEREARGSALGVQSRGGSCDFADGFPVIRPGTARLPRRFAPRNDTSGWRAVHQCPCAVEYPCTRRSVSAATPHTLAFAISTMVRSFRRCSAGHGCPLPRNYNTWSAASRSFPLSIFSLPQVPFLKTQFQTRCVLGGAQRVFSGKMTVLRHFSV